MFIRWILPFGNNLHKKNNPLCPLSALVSATRGALCPAGTVPAWRVPAQRRGNGSRGRHVLRTTGWATLLQHRLQTGTCKSQSLPMSNRRERSGHKKNIRQALVQLSQCTGADFAFARMLIKQIQNQKLLGLALRYVSRN